MYSTIETERAPEIYQWCKENFGPEGSRWKTTWGWYGGHAADGSYGSEYLLFMVCYETDMMAYILRWT